MFMILIKVRYGTVHVPITRFLIKFLILKKQ